jgi:subtilase family serine protease
VVSESVQRAPPRLPSAPGRLFIPKSNRPQPVPPGQKFVANTNVEVFIPEGLKPQEALPSPGYLGYETPASFACHYGLVSGGGPTAACNPTTTTVNPTGGSQSIAIVDAYDDPNAPGDLAWFSDQFGIPLKTSQFQVVWANTRDSSCSGDFGGWVPVDETGGWEGEESMDVEYAHAMAPNATIYLVEACGPDWNDLYQAIRVANNLVQCGKTEIGSDYSIGTCPSTSTGKGEVSMSWGGAEPKSVEASFDSVFTTPGVVYFASAGDRPGVSYPCASPNVVCAGGTASAVTP